MEGGRDIQSQSRGSPETPNQEAGPGEVKSPPGDLMDMSSFPFREKSWSSGQWEEPSNESVTKLLCELR